MQVSSCKNIGVWSVRGTVRTHWDHYPNFSQVGLKIFCLWKAVMVRNGQFLQKYVRQVEEILRFHRKLTDFVV